MASGSRTGLVAISPFVQGIKMDSLAHVVTFDDGRIRLDSGARKLVINDQPAKLGGRAFDLLEALIARRHRVVPKQELLDVVWPGLIVEENNLQVHVTTLRKLMGPQSIATVQGRGYRFVLEPDLRVGADASQTGAIGEDPDQSEAEGTTLIGRATLIADVCARLLRSNVRMVTLSGPGGSGKTRLGLHATAELAHGFADGSYVVMLAPIRDPARVPSAIAGVLNVQEAGAKPAQELILAYLRDREMLLMLDNFEHLLEATPFLTLILSACSRVKLLITSRTNLHAAAGDVVVVPPLALPERTASRERLLAAPAVRLFLDRAREAGRAVDHRNAADVKAVADVCRRLDGLPLAIELAVARLRVLSPRELSDRLSRRLALLKGGTDASPPRQRTLRDTIEWSYDLLGSDEQTLFRRLAVFVGGWSLDAAEAVAGRDLADRVLDLLTALIDHNLVQRIEEVDGESRFAMLETVREFAQERLDASVETTDVRHRHAGYFVDLAAFAEPHLTGAERRPWLRRLSIDYNNLRTALSWLVIERMDVEPALRLVSALPWMWYFVGQFSEGRGWIHLALDLAVENRRDTVMARLLSGASRLATYSGAIDEAIGLARRSVEIWREFGDRRGLAFALAHEAIPLLVIKQRDAAVRLLRESKDCFFAIGDDWGVAFATTYEGIARAYEAGTEDQAQPLLTEGRARFQALNDEWGVTTSSHYLGTIALRKGDYVAARELTEEMLANARDLGDNYRVSRNLHQLAEIALAQHQLAQAQRNLLDSLALNRDQGRVGDAALQMRLLGRIALMMNDPARAARLFGAASTHDGRERTLPADDAEVNEAALASARSQLGEHRFGTEWVQGTAMSFAAAADFALEPIGISTTTPN